MRTQVVARIKHWWQFHGGLRTSRYAIVRYYLARVAFDQDPVTRKGRRFVDQLNEEQVTDDVLLNLPEDQLIWVYEYTIIKANTQM